MRVRGGLLMAMVGMALAGPVAAQPMPGVAPPGAPGPDPLVVMERPGVPLPALMGQRDPELTAVVRDIVILRAINSLGMTVEQMRRLITLLEQTLEADRRLRAEAMSQLEAQRQRMLAGTATAEETRDALEAVAAARRRYGAEVERIMSQAGTFLSAEQVERLKRLGAGGLQSDGRAAAPEPAPRVERPARRDREPGAPPERPALGPADGPRAPAPSAEVIAHIVHLLKQKVAAMTAAGASR